METIWLLPQDYTFRVVALGTMMLGAVSGVLGSFAMLRRQSLLGDAISHAALPGIVIAFLLTRSKASLVLMIGAALTGWLASQWMAGINRHTRIKDDSALGLVLSVFFGIGLMLLTYTQRLADARQAGLDQFLFGQAATLLVSDVITIFLLGGFSLLLVAMFWKEFKILTFDRDYATCLGLPTGRIDILIVTLLVVAIVIGLQTVGVILISALIVAPAATARQWTNNLGVMVFLSAIFGLLAGFCGAIASAIGEGLSTGPVIVLVSSFMVIFSFVFAPSRGLLWAKMRHWGKINNEHISG